MTESHMADGLFKTLQNKIKSDPKDPYNYSDLATLYWHVDDAQDLAQKTYEQGLAACPKDISLQGEYAYFLGKTGRDIPKARQIFADLVAAPKVTSFTLGQAAEFFWQAVGDLEIADALYQEAMGKDRDDEILVSQYADFLWRGMGNGPKAKSAFAKAFKMDQIEDEGILAAFATFLWQSENEIEMAAKYFKQALEEEPEQPWIYQVYAEFKKATGR